MEDARFDHLVRAVAGAASRRTLLGAATLPAIGAGLAFLDPEGAEARKRQHRHKGKGKGASAEKKRKRKKRKKAPAVTTTLPPTCTPDAPTTTCAGKCGKVTNNCFQTIECGSCVCDPPCGECFTCDIDTKACVFEPDATPCGPGPTCVNSFQRFQDFCDGVGTCNPSGGQSCEPYLCDEAGIACRTTCSSDGDCNPLAYCDPDGHCNGKHFAGETCAADNECLSDACCGSTCQDCCNNADCGDSGLICLNSTCQSCVNSPGNCDNGTCCNGLTGACVADCPGAQLCGANNTCAAPCGSHADCGADALCLEGICHGCTVTENGFVSLQTAITNATAGDTLYICPGYYTYAQGENAFLIDKQLTLIGAGDGAGGTRIRGQVYVSNAGTLEAPVIIRNVRVLTLFRGVLLVGGNLLITDSTVRGGNGRGVDVDGGTLEMRRCEIIGNTQAGAEGVGLRNLNGAVTLRNCRVEGNSGAVGAGIRTANLTNFTATLELYSTEVRGNTSSSSGAGVSNVQNTPGSSTVTVSNDSAICANTPTATQCENIDPSRCFAVCPD